MTQVWRQISGLLPAFALVVAAVALLAVVRYRHHRKVCRRLDALGLTSGDAVIAANLLFVALVALMPVQVFPGDPTRPLNLVPFKEWADLISWSPGSAVVEVFGNIALFVPTAVALALRAAWPTWRVVRVVSAIALSIEVAQFAFALGRVASVTDVIAPAIGAGIAATFTRRVLCARRQPATSGARLL